jgi:hypothetical protein
MSLGDGFHKPEIVPGQVLEVGHAIASVQEPNGIDTSGFAEWK